MGPGISVSPAHALPDCDALMFTVSGNVPEEPVCTADGYVFEKRLVEKHLEVSVVPATGSGMANWRAYGGWSSPRTSTLPLYGGSLQPVNVLHVARAGDGQAPHLGRGDEEG